MLFREPCHLSKYRCTLPYCARDIHVFVGGAGSAGVLQQKVVNLTFVHIYDGVCYFL